MSDSAFKARVERIARGEFDEEWVDVGAGLIVLRRLELRWEADEEVLGPKLEEAVSIPVDVTVSIEYSDEARSYRVVRVLAEDPALTSEALRAIPLARIVRNMAALAVRGVLPDDEGVFLHLSEEEMAERFGEGDDAQPGPGLYPLVMPDPVLPRKFTDQSWRDIELVHRVHQVFGDSPTTKLADYFDVSNATAYRWIKELQDRREASP